EFAGTRPVLRRKRCARPVGMGRARCSRLKVEADVAAQMRREIFRPLDPQTIGPQADIAPLAQLWGRLARLRMQPDIRPLAVPASGAGRQTTEDLRQVCEQVREADVVRHGYLRWVGAGDGDLGA